MPTGIVKGLSEVAELVQGYSEVFQRLLDGYRESQRYIQDGWVVLGMQNCYRDSCRSFRAE